MRQLEKPIFSTKLKTDAPYKQSAISRVRRHEIFDRIQMSKGGDAPYNYKLSRYETN
ncbi:MAG: hypothetical protein QQW96_00010 [Tychonema bourrellyi B0820]|uniref:hypothetical protein n=1 Tax=Tychonema bourrellyi TaxID=54313 RepID=UPI0015D4FD12|nr:hypothetical protein [Tychonema bourrellyi]MDQ2096023.1 hypothetical protein [Tychonema bourrellyi B0820]